MSIKTKSIVKSIGSRIESYFERDYPLIEFTVFVPYIMFVCWAFTHKDDLIDVCKHRGVDIGSAMGAAEEIAHAANPVGGVYKIKKAVTQVTRTDESK